MENNSLWACKSFFSFWFDGNDKGTIKALGMQDLVQ
jgi:hypothetical protein